MSDQNVDVMATGEPEVTQPQESQGAEQTAEQTKESQQSMTTLRLNSPFPLHSSFTCGEGDNKFTINRNGSQVPSDQVEGILRHARNAGFSLEVVSES